MGLEFRLRRRDRRRKGAAMIRIRDIPLPPGHSPQALQAAAAKILRLPPREIQRLQIVRRSLDARKKERIQWIYTVDVSVSGSEHRAIRQGGAKASPAPVFHYDIPRPARLPQMRPVVAGFGPAGVFAARRRPDSGPWSWSGGKTPRPATVWLRPSGRPAAWIPGATSSLGRAAPEPSPTGS